MQPVTTQQQVDNLKLVAERQDRQRLEDGNRRMAQTLQVPMQGVYQLTH